MGGPPLTPVWEFAVSETVTEEHVEQVESHDEKPSPDRGFPENTPVQEMTDAQKAAYFRHQNRKSEGLLKNYKGVTPEQIQQMQAELDTLRGEKLSADEKALEEAKKQAADDARHAEREALTPRLLRAELKGIASQVLSGDKLTAWLDDIDPSKFTNSDGEIDEEKVMGKLTALFGVQSQETPRRNWGQYAHSGAAPGSKPGDAGRAEAKKRFGDQAK